MTKKIEVFASESLPGELEAFPDIKRGWGTTKEITGGIPPMKWFNAIQKRTDEAINAIAEGSINGYTFKDGATLESHSDLIYDDVSKSWYFWIGESGKVIPPDSNASEVIESDGGIWSDANPDGLWVSVGDGGLRSDIKANSGASIIGTESGSSLQSVITKLSKGYLSESDGDLQALVNSVTDVFIDEDIDITTDIIIPSNTNIKTINGAKIHFKNGRLRTQAIPPASYWSDNDSNRQIAIIEDVPVGATTVKLQSTSGLSVGDKLVLKNGYCDMWRVLETSDKALFAVKQQPYNSEIVEITSVSNESVGISPTKYSYLLTPKTYGYIENENSLPQYAGYNRPSATRILYSNIKIDIDVVVNPEQAGGIGLMAYVDGISLSIKSHSLSNSITPFVIRMSDNTQVHNAVGFGHKGLFVSIEESCRGGMSRLRMDSWKGGGDTPFLAMLMCSVIIDDAIVNASVKHGDASAVYINTCDGGIITNVIAKNTPKIVDFSFSRAVQTSKLSGSNVDFVVGGYRSVGCSATNGIVDGYCFLNETSTIYTNVLLPTSNCIDNTFSNIKRINDMGYGRVLIQYAINLRMSDIHSPKTMLFLHTVEKQNEIAQGESSLIVKMNDCSFGIFYRDSSYYDSENQAGKSYPNVAINRTTFNGEVTLGKLFNQLDIYDIQTDYDVIIGNACFAVRLSGRAKSLLLEEGANELTCIPNISGLVLETPPVEGVFASVDSILGGGGAIGYVYYTGAVITDVYSRSEWVNVGTRGAGVRWVKK